MTALNDGASHRDDNVEPFDPIRSAATGWLASGNSTADCVFADAKCRRRIRMFETVSPMAQLPTALPRRWSTLKQACIFHIDARGEYPETEPSTWRRLIDGIRTPDPKHWRCLLPACSWAAAAVIHAVPRHSRGGDPEQAASIILDAKVAGRLLLVTTVAPHVAEWADILRPLPTKVVYAPGAGWAPATARANILNGSVA